MRLPALLCLTLLWPALPAQAGDADRLGSLLDGDPPATAAPARPTARPAGKAAGGKSAGTPDRGNTPNAPPSASAFGALFDESPGSAAPRRSVDELLGDAADKPLLDERLTAARERHRIKAEVTCANRLRDIRTCLARRGCPEPSAADRQRCEVAHCGAQPNKDICDSYEPWCAGDTEDDWKRWRDSGEPPRICLTGRACHSWRPNPNWDTWHDCATTAVECRADAGCVAQCDPDGSRDLNACTAREAARNAPTEADARAGLERERREAARASAGKDRSRKTPGTAGEPEHAAVPPHPLLQEAGPPPAPEKEIVVREMQFHGSDFQSAAVGCTRAEDAARDWDKIPEVVALVNKSRCTCREQRETLTKPHHFFCTVELVLRFERGVRHDHGDGSSSK